MGQLEFGDWSILGRDGYSLHCVEGGICAVNDFAENRVLAVEMGLLRVRDEELGFIRVGTAVGHCDHASGIKL